MTKVLNERCKPCGIEVKKMEIMEVAYHAEVAQSLLLVQQAQAKIDARALIVEGAVSIVNGALEQLDQKGITMSTDRKEELVTKLMVITCSDQGAATPVFNV